MNRFFAACAALAVVAVALVSPPATRTAAADIAESYFKCQSGYSLQTSGQNVRCYKVGATQTIMPSCAPGTALVQNVVGNADRCRAANGQNFAYVCPPTHPAEVRAKQDMCVRKDPPSIIAPAVPVSV